MIKFFKKARIPLVIYLFTPGAAFAAAKLLPPPTPIKSIDDIILAITKLLTWVFTIFFLVAAIVIVLAAYNYLTAGGNEEKISTAKKQLTWAIVAIAIALVARGIEFVVKELVSPSSGGVWI